jgi:anti-sigma B factor antagonist
MNLEKKRYDDVVILKFAGEFDAFNLPTFSQRIDTMIDAGDRQLVLDLHLLKFINSAALGYLIKTSKRLKEMGGGMVLARPSRFIRKTLATLGLETVFPVFETVEDGILHFKKGEAIGQLRLDDTETDETLTGAVPILFRRDTKETSAAPPNQVGRILSLYEDGLLFLYEPEKAAKPGTDPIAEDLKEGSKLKLKFRQPFAIKDHYFEMTGTVANATKAESDGNTTVRMKYDRIKDDDRKHLQQFVRDLDSWKSEIGVRR